MRIRADRPPRSRSTLGGLFGQALSSGGGGNTGDPSPIFNLPLLDLGAGAVDTTPIFAAGSPTATFTRATAGWTKLSSGLWASVASGTARSAYLGMDTTVGAYGGYLAEGLRTDNALWNRDLTNAAWVSGGGGVATAKTATGIDGVANSCTTLTASGANGTLLQSITLASQANVFQPFIKRRTGTGTINITLDGGTTWTDVTSQINSSTFTLVQATKTAANPIIGFRIVTSGDAIDVDMAGMQNGAFASSPIPTTTVAVARNQDVLTYVTSGNLNSTTGALVASVTGKSSLAAGWFVGDGSAAFYYTSNVLTLFDGTANRGTQSITLSDTPQKVGGSWGGTLSRTALSGTASADLGFDGNMGFGASFGVGCTAAGANQIYGTIGGLTSYGQLLSSAQLQAMTA